MGGMAHREKGDKSVLSKPETIGEWSPALQEKKQRLTAQARACAGWATLEEHDKVLDMACSDGGLLRRLGENCRLTLCGMCESPDQARNVREALGEADVISSRVDDIPWRDGTFNAVILPAVLRGEDFRRALGEVRRVLKAGGQFVLAAPMRLFRGEDGLTRRETMRLLQENGFREVSFRAGFPCGVIIGWKKTEEKGAAQ